MKILIAYATRGGVTKTCADKLAALLTEHHEVLVCSAEQELPCPSDFDVVVLGSHVRFGKVNAALKQYIRRYAAQLSEMPCAVFLCCGFPRNFEEYVDTQIPKALHCSLGFHSFGGELKPEKLKGMDRLIVKIARRSICEQDFEESDRDHHILPEIFCENIRLLANKISDIAYFSKK